MHLLPAALPAQRALLPCVPFLFPHLARLCHSETSIYLSHMIGGLGDPSEYIPPLQNYRCGRGCSKTLRLHQEHDGAGVDAVTHSSC